MAPASYQALADLVALVHLAVVVFVVGGLAVVWPGNRLGWRWVNGWGFRLAHLGAIVFVVGQSWLGQLCPLTLLEHWLRMQAGAQQSGAAGFIETWVHRLIFFQAPTWVFTVLYTVFALLVLGAWWVFPPQRRRG